MPSSGNYTNGSNISAKVTDQDTTTVAVTNTYSEKTGVSISLKGTKHLDDAAATTAGQFSFTVAKGTMDAAVAANVTLPNPATVQNDANGDFIIAGITFAKDGTYQLLVTEDDVADSTIEKDGTRYEITVVVEETATGYSVSSVSKTTETATAGVYAINNLTNKLTGASFDKGIGG